MSWNATLGAKKYVYRRQPPCEAVSWNSLNSSHWCWSPVSLLVRLWVEIYKSVGGVHCTKPSASLWGCELKWKQNQSRVSRQRVSLLVRLWVEIQCLTHPVSLIWSASLWGCELKWFPDRLSVYRPVSASLWGCELKYHSLIQRLKKKRSASLWGCELKYYVVRRCYYGISSASLWGCELKCTETVIGCIWRLVSLLVRLWVEMFSLNLEYSHFPSASLWGCELKLLEWLRQFKSDKSASLWGCELKCLPRPY